VVALQGTPRKSWISYLACYLVWACLGALGLYAALVWRTTILSLAVGRDRWTATLMDQLGSIVLMLLWVVFVIWLEAFLRRGLVLIHRALPNILERYLRLSVDNRYQLASDPIDPSSLRKHYDGWWESSQCATATS